MVHYSYKHGLGSRHKRNTAKAFEVPMPCNDRRSILSLQGKAKELRMSFLIRTV